MADEPKLVVALEARLDKFEKQLRDAGLIAERQLREIETKTSQITFGVAAGNLIAKGIEAGIKGAIESIKAAIEETKELGSVARKTGLDFEALQRIGGATAMTGMDSKEFLSGLTAAARAMNDINHGETRLSQLLDDNNVKYRERNGQVVNVNRGLDLAAALMAKANNALDKEKIAEIFGLTQKWVAVLGEGPEKLAQMKANANINKELEAGVAATKALGTIVDTISGEFKNWGTNIITYVLGPLQSMVTILATLSAGIAAIHKGTGNFAEGPSQAIADAMARIKAVTDQAIADSKRPQITIRPGGVKGLGGRAGGAVDSEKDALTRQEEQLRKNIALREAELQTIGLSVGKQEELRQITLLQEAALRASNGASNAITESMRQQAAEAGRITQLLVEKNARWNDMLSASKELGSTLSDAMKGMVLEGKKFDEVLKNIGNRIASKAFDKLFDAMFASPSGGGGSLFMNLLGIKAMMAGGPVSGGSPYLVGERGPELFVPGRSGRIVPNTALGGGGGSGITIGGPRTAINIAGSADRETVLAMRAMLAERDKRFVSDVASASRELRRRSVRA